MAKSAFTAVFAVIDRVTAPLRKLQRSFRPIKMAFKDISESSSRVTSALAGIAAPIAAVFGAAGLGSVAAIGSKVIGTSAEFEKFQTVLETLEGSSAKAKASMDWVQTFAAKTPYDLASTTDAFVKLKAYGIDPQAGALKSAGDAAAAMGKPLEGAVEALADAMTGENERLKEFGITASTAGDQITYRWQENGKAMVAVADKNSKAMIQSTIEGIWNGRFGGAMDKLSGTWDGMWSNLQDTFTKFFKMIGDAGVFDMLKGELKGLLDTFSAMEADGSLKALALAISTGLVDAFKELKSWVMAVDWRGVWADLKGFGTAVIGVISALGGLKGVAIIFGVLFATSAVTSVLSLGMALVSFGAMIIPMLAGAGTAFMGLLVAMGPIGWIIAGIAAAGVALYANWDTVGPWFAELWKSIQVGAEVFWAWIKDAFFTFSPLGMIIKNWDPIVGYFSGLWDKVKGFIEPITGAVGAAGDFLAGGGSAQSGSPAPTHGRFGVAGQQKLNGQMVVSFENSPLGMKVASGKTNQPGVAMEADVGYRSLAMP